MEVAFTLYKGFLIAEYSETDVRAYRSRAYYADNTASYETGCQRDTTQAIDYLDDRGDFTELEYNTLMQELGRVEPGRYETTSPKTVREIAVHMRDDPSVVAEAMYKHGMITEAEREGFAQSVKVIATDWLSAH